MDDDEVVWDSPDCTAVEDVVCGCLDDQGIQYLRDDLLEGLILIKNDADLEGVPDLHNPHSIELGDNEIVLPSFKHTEAALDKFDVNPVRLLNHVKLRQLNSQDPHKHETLWYPRKGNRVRLGFYVPDAPAPKVVAKYRPLAQQMQIESMEVEVTSIRTRGSLCVYHGELMDAPVFIDPSKLRMGSPVAFTAEQVYPRNWLTPECELNVDSE